MLGIAAMGSNHSIHISTSDLRDIMTNANEVKWGRIQGSIVRLLARTASLGRVVIRLIAKYVTFVRRNSFTLSSTHPRREGVGGEPAPNSDQAAPEYLQPFRCSPTHQPTLNLGGGGTRVLPHSESKKTSNHAWLGLSGDDEINYHCFVCLSTACLACLRYRPTMGSL